MAASDLENDDELMPEAGGDGSGGRNGGTVTAADDDDPKGPGHPPKEHQFKKGQSGNPRGRPKGAKGLRTIFDREMNERLSINVNGKKQSLSKLELTIKRLTEKAMKGEQRAIDKLIELNISMFGLGDEETSQAAKLTPGEIALLEMMVNRLPSGDAEVGHQADPDVARDVEDDDDAD